MQKSCLIVLICIAAVNPAAAQVVIPHGNPGDGFEKYLIATISLLLLCFAVWRYFGRR